MHGCHYRNRTGKVKNKMKQCCGTCAYQHFENISDGWVCCNEKSDYRADWTGYEDSCKELEEKDDGE